MLTRRFVQIAAALLATVALGTANAGAVSTLAATMQPGAWAEVTSMGGWNAGEVLVPRDLGCTTGDYITQFAEKAAWDPVTDRVLFIGQAHGSCYGGRFVIYSEQSNAWSQGPWPSGICQSGTATSPCFSHAYDHNTIDPITGDMYFRQAFTMKFFRFRNGAWSSIPAPPTQGNNCCGALEFFPDINRLIFIDGEWGAWAFNPGNNSWTQIANTNVANAKAGVPNLPMIAYNNFALYNPVKKILLLGGGNKVYSLDSASTFKSLKAPPVSLGVTDAVLSLDPVSGKFIALSGSSVYQYDSDADSWGTVNTTMPATLRGMDGVGDGLIQAPITEYGVIMFIKFNFADSKVFLYKHSPFTPAASPSAPTALNAN